MGRRSSVHGDFLNVKTAIGLERFEDKISGTATTSLSELTFLSLEKIRCFVPKLLYFGYNKGSKYLSHS